MSDLVEHENDCKLLLGKPYGDVHRWLDETFGQFGPTHRKIRHNRQGIETVRSMLGATAALAATIHILRDCQGIPDIQDYRSGRVDPLGFAMTRSVQQIASYSDEEFYKLASELIDDNHKCLLLLGWLENAPQLLHLVKSVVSNPSADFESSATYQWEKAREFILRLNDEGEPDSEQLTLETPRAFEPLSDEDFQGLGENAKSILENLKGQLGTVNLGWILADSLINPLQLIDLDYANHLAAGISPQPTDRQAMEFAAPERLNINAQALKDNKSASVVTRFQELYLQSVEANVEPDIGFELRFKISPLPQYILVIEKDGRYILRSGMHRAFVLARAGMKRIPCFLARDVEMPPIVGPYPVYPTTVLRLPRPPKLLDSLNSNLCLKTAFQQSRRILRIAAEELLIPIN
ncbi:hypothetical protein BH10ACI4_BH10ACI4_33850 [soil metagenome]